MITVIERETKLDDELLKKRQVLIENYTDDTTDIQLYNHYLVEESNLGYEDINKLFISSYDLNIPRVVEKVKLESVDVKPILLKDNRYVLYTTHSIERMMDKMRFTDEQKKFFKDNYKKVLISAVTQIINKHGDKEAYYGIHSESTGLGMIIYWKKDSFGEVPDEAMEYKHALIVTILPIKKYHNFKPNDIVLMVEGLIRETLILNGCMLKDLRYQVESYSLIDDNDITFFEGKLCNSLIKEFLIVD